jgi:hypothetical protein
MARRIIQLTAHDALDRAWLQRDPVHAAKHLDGLRCKGVRLLEKYPIRVQSTHRALSEHGARRVRASKPTFAVLASIDDLEAERRLAHDSRNSVIGIFADLPIAPATPPYCDVAAVGSASDVGNLIRSASFVDNDATGRGVDIAVVDVGVDETKVPVRAGWSPPGVDYRIGSANSLDPGDAHGTMCAFDARLGAPEADILDYALLRATDNTLQIFLSDALAAFADLIDRREADPDRPLVVTNSWQVFDRSSDAPVGDPANYSANLNHPVCQQITALLAAGADVLFCAGNCGLPCPVDGCLQDGTGPGKSILGANAHPDVITIAAVTLDGTRLGYSAQGPGAITTRKPDVAGYAQFSADVAYPIHIGTSAACPVVAGIVAALRSTPKGAALSPAALKGVLQQTATNPAHVWTADLGYGIINPNAALEAILRTP